MSTQPNSNPAVAGNNGRLLWPLVAVIFAVSALMIMVAARGDLAIDEVVSLNKALGVHSWTEIFTRDQNDNNHLLNTLFMDAFGPQTHLFIYRIPAVIFGIALLAVLIVTSARLGKTLPVWVAFLSGLSYPMVLYSSEARGYAPAMFSAVLAYEMLQRCWERCTAPKLILFWAALALGILSHFSFIMVCMALGIWLLAHDYFARANVQTVAANALKYFGVPVIFLGAIYLVYIRHMIILGGPVQTYWDAVSDTALYLLGFAIENGLRVVAAVLVLAMILGGIWKLFRQKGDEWVFFIAMMFVAPTVVIILFQPKFLYFRYFIVCFPFFYLLLASLFADWFEKPGKIKLVPVLLLAFISVGHLVKDASLLHYGRGNYHRAMLEMAAATPGPIIKVSSDHDFRNGTLLDFYARFLPPGKQLEYITRPQRDQERPEWFIQHCLDPSFRAYADVEVGGIGKYDLFGDYPFCGSSGWSWFVYHRLAEAIPAKAAAAMAGHD